MTLAEALNLQRGDRIASPLEGYKIRTLTYGVWINADQTDVCVSMASWHSGEWISPLAWVRVPKGAHYSAPEKSWVRMKKRKGRPDERVLIPLGGPFPEEQFSMDGAA